MVDHTHVSIQPSRRTAPLHLLFKRVCAEGIFVTTTIAAFATVFRYRFSLPLFFTLLSYFLPLRSVEGHA